ncbi:phage tail protein I [Pseudoalteromonas sp. MSK9-3]|uniref:phage tail protein I n=1 Tax=Pseudoalteromonas sp. MSK9-3 TaxID=1897633 RepID=UPI000E6BE237|nr:phage tail protein I [Pseudoalteromonas sp. MSK9-3]RJE78131.1 phage tail protein I [Pseudoalteromonas sp. MSK9-3]
MSDLKALPDLLPHNASLLMRSLAELLTYPDKSQLLKHIWHPQDCPAELLPWLAWALSVDDWNDAWSENTKRQMIDDAFVVHQFKATPFALKKALDSLNIETDIHEWWHQIDAQPGTIVVNAMVNENLDSNEEGLLTKAMLAQVKRIIDTVKRASIHVEVQLGIALKEQFGMGIHASAGTGLLSKEGVFNGVRPDAGYIDLAASLNAQPGIGSLQQQGDFNGVTPDDTEATLGAVLAGQKGIGALEHSLDMTGVVPNAMAAGLNLCGYGQVNIAAMEAQASWKGVWPESCTATTVVSAALSQLQLTYFTLQGAT